MTLGELIPAGVNYLLPDFKNISNYTLSVCNGHLKIRATLNTTGKTKL